MIREYFPPPSGISSVGRNRALSSALTKWESYPPKMIPGLDIMVCTTATNDKDARLLLSSMGVPFHGKHIN